MPPAYLADKRGKPLLSWRVALLPYLGQQDLYERFHLDEPWDSPHNRQLIPLMPDTYRDPVAASNPYAAPAKDAPGKDTAGRTRFLLLRGPKTVYADPTPPMPRMFEDWMKVIVVVVVPERAVPWTKPEEFIYDPKDPSAGLAKEKSGSDFMLIAGGELSDKTSSGRRVALRKRVRANGLAAHVHRRRAAVCCFTGHAWEPLRPRPRSGCSACFAFRF